MNNQSIQSDPLPNIILDRNRPRNIVFYGRVSTEHEAQLSALQNQIQWYDDQLKFHPNWNLVERYIDEGITGTQAKKRPGFLKMIDDAKKGKFDLIVTREVCRFARNTVDTLIYTRELKSKYNIEVYFVDDNIWTMDGDGELRLALMATLAQEESRKTSDRVKAGQKISRENGSLYGNGNILGYNRAGKTYVINKEQAETVRMIYDMYLDGLGSMKIAKQLAIMQRKNASGNIKWSAERVMRILKKSTYTGVLAYGQSYSNNYLEQKRINNLDRDTYMYQKVNIPQIIPQDKWDEVQKIIASRTRKMGEDLCGKKEVKEFWSKKLLCKCGSSFRRNKWRTNKTGEEVFGYQCQRQINYGSKQFREKNGLDTEGYCDIRMVADWKLDMMAKMVIEHIWKNKGESIILALKMIQENYQEDVPQSKKNNKEIELKIEKLQNRMTNLIEMRADGEITKEEFTEQKNSINDKISMLKSELVIDDIESDKPESIEKKIQVIRQVIDETIDFSQPKLPKAVIDKFVLKVVVLDNNKFRWYLKLNNISDLDEDIYLDAKVDGRKNNASAQILSGDDSLVSIHSSTGSNRRNKGEIISLGFVITYKMAQDYRYSIGKYLRKNQWGDINIDAEIEL